MSEIGTQIWAAVGKAVPIIGTIDQVLHFIGGAPDPSLCDYLDAWVQAVSSAGAVVTLGDVRTFATTYFYRLASYGDSCPEYGINTNCLNAVCYVTIGNSDSLRAEGTAAFNAFLMRVAELTADAGAPDYTGVVLHLEVPDETLYQRGGLHLTVSGGQTLGADDPGQLAATYAARDVAKAQAQGVYALPLSVGGGLSQKIPAFIPDPVQPVGAPKVSKVSGVALLAGSALLLLLLLRRR